MTYRVIPRLSFGIEYNPRADDTSPLANFVAITETRRRPALMFGTSSDRIGTPEGQSYYFTLSKDLSTVNGWPVAPYVGAAYGSFEDEIKGIVGLHVRLPGTGFSSTMIHDGKNFHPTLGYRFLERHVVSLLWVDTDDIGFAYSVAF